MELVSKNSHLIIIGLYAYVLLYHIKDTDYVSMVLLTVIACMAICYLKKQNSVKPYNLVEGQENNTCGGAGAAGRGAVNEGFENDEPVTERVVKKPTGYDIVRELPASMGAYDGLCLQTGNKESWMKNPYNVSLVPNDSLFTYLGSQGPIKPVFSDTSSFMGPPVDGDPESPKKMFMFANNRTSPDCCPGTFSTSTGCVCTTDKQRDFIASRGNQGSVNLSDI